ncbi:MAG: chemotaxis protein CheW [Rhodospirillales bacterium]|nr:chemotaxis protein CheW [Rhodospirillales bacterium]
MVDATIDATFQSVATDAPLKALFEGIDLDLLQGHWRDAVVKALGNINRYKPADLSKLFAPAVARGFGQGQFKALLGHVEGALKMLEVQPDVAAEVQPLFAGIKDDLLAGDKAATKTAVVAKGEGAAGGAVEQAKESTVAGQSIRVHVDVLENLMTMVSELVLTRNQLLQILRSQQESEFAAPLQRLSQVTSELQEGVMKTRMQPIGNAWAKLPRIVRDLSVELHKKIDLQMHGAETELDRQVLELIRDPLTHMVRNSGDHGIEMPADRLAAGKPETGTINLNAYHEGGHIIIEIADDGRGLNVERIKAKALSSGLTTESELDAMPEQQIYQFIFKAGFSTAAQVTAVSGRGVGMDVVRTNIEKIGGTVELRSREGKGTTFVIKIPLTLAIVSALIVECAGERFAIPQMSVLELVRTSSNSEHTIEQINGAPVMRLRDRLLSLVSLRDLLKLSEGGESKQKKDENYIVVAQVGTFTFGIMVDRVFDTEEIVVKPVAPILRHIQMFSGNTILGDGSVIMILDPNGIATAASGERAQGDGIGDAAAANDRAYGDGEKVAILTFRAGDGGPKAVPLALIARLEEFEVEKIEAVGDRRVMQYRGKLMPLIPIEPGYQPLQSGRQPVLVFSDGDRSMGLLVDEIIDVVEERLQIELSASRPGVIGTAVISGKSTELVDAGHYLTLAFGDWFSRGTLTAEKKRQKRLLLVEDSSFFRHMITPVLSVAGYEVTAVDTAKKALDLCERGLDVDVIVSDIEMPEMNGYEFVSAVRGTARWGNLPVLALSSNTAPEHIERGRAAGFDDYVAKSDRDALLASLEQTMANEGDHA